LYFISLVLSVKTLKFPVKPQEEKALPLSLGRAERHGFEYYDTERYRSRRR
jgi:hypothetical protein